MMFCVKFIRSVSGHIGVEASSPEEVRDKALKMADVGGIDFDYDEGVIIEVEEDMDSVSGGQDEIG